MTEGETKKPSKGELKKAAKKAEKAAKKAAAVAAKAAEAGNVKGKGSDNKKDTAPAATKVVVPFDISNTDGHIDAALKVVLTALFYQVPLKKSATSSNTPPFIHGPILSYESKQVAFGANAVCKALSFYAGKLNTSLISNVDEWLEFERQDLRTADKKKLPTAVSVIEQGLAHNSQGGGFFLVGDGLSIADISILVTLKKIASEIALPDSVKSYVNHHISSKLFETAKASDILKASPPPPSPIDFKTDPSMKRAVRSVFLSAISKAFPDLDQSIINMEKLVAPCNNAKHGDYQCIAAMQLFKPLKKSGAAVQSPQQVAQSIIDSVDAQTNTVCTDFIVNGPGFIICKITSAYLSPHINSILAMDESSSEVVGPKAPSASKSEKVVVDFSSPNIAKEMHVGHLRSTIIGESVCRILEFCGNKVDRVNHVGDWGTQFGMLIQFLKEEGLADDEKKASGSITDLTVFYKKAKERFDADADFKKSSQINVVHLQSGDPECLRIWNILCDVSRREFEKVYKRLSVTVYECGESFYNDKIPGVITEFEKAGHIDVAEGGAKCVFVPKFKIPLMLQKSDGGYGYDSTDMAALKYRLQKLNATRLVYITDFSQGDHFKMCFAAADKIGWVDKDNHRLEHIGFGTVQGEDGKRFKTRSGDTVRLVDLLDEAVSRMEKSLNERIAEGKANISKEQVSEVASILGNGAVKYFDLRRNPTTNYKFSYDAMLDTKGNTAIYLLYAHARLESIIKKGSKEHNIDVDELIKSGKVSVILGHQAEIKLAKNLHMFTDVLETTLDDMYPYHICDILYNISTAAADFVTQCRVLGSDEMESRLLLCRATAVVMRKCFDLLGIGYVNSI